MKLRLEFILFPLLADGVPALLDSHISSDPASTGLAGLCGLGLRPSRWRDRILWKTGPCGHVARAISIPGHPTRIWHRWKCVNRVGQTGGGGQIVAFVSVRGADQRGHQRTRELDGPGGRFLPLSDAWNPCIFNFACFYPISSNEDEDYTSSVFSIKSQTRKMPLFCSP